MLRYACLLFLAAATAPAADYQLKVTPQTIAWGYYWADAKPALTVKSGDTVEVECVSVGNPQTLMRAGLREDQIEPDILRQL